MRRCRWLRRFRSGVLRVPPDTVAIRQRRSRSTRHLRDLPICGDRRDAFSGQNTGRSCLCSRDRLAVNHLGVVVIDRYRLTRRSQDVWLIVFGARAVLVLLTVPPLQHLLARTCQREMIAFEAPVDLDDAGFRRGRRRRSIGRAHRWPRAGRRQHTDIGNNERRYHHDSRRHAERGSGRQARMDRNAADRCIHRSLPRLALPVRALRA